MKFSKNKILFFLILFLIALLLPFFVHSPILNNILTISFLWAFVGMCWNLTGGFTGIFSLGHSAFFGTGGYAIAIGCVNYNLPLWVGVIIGCLVATIFAIFIGLISLRLSGMFFAVSTMAMASMLFYLALQFKNITRGSLGIPLPFAFLDKTKSYYIILFLVVFLIILSQKILNSKFGLYLLAIRENEEGAKALGINTLWHKVVITALSGLLTSIGGIFYYFFLQYIDPYTAFGTNVSILPALVTMVGGIGNTFGPLLGSFIIIPISELIRGTLGTKFTGLSGFLYGLLLIIITRSNSEGIITYFPKITSLKIFSSIFSITSRKRNANE